MKNIKKMYLMNQKMKNFIHNNKNIFNKVYYSDLFPIKKRMILLIDFFKIEQ